MMKFFVFLVLLLNAVSLSAQQFNLTLSEEKGYKGSRGILACGTGFFDLDMAFGVPTGLGFHLYKNTSKVKITKYDSQLNLVLENKLFDNDDIAGPLPPLLRKWNDRLFLVYTVPHKSKDGFKVMISQVDQHSLKLSEATEAMTVTQGNVGVVKSLDFLNFCYFNVCYSGDNQHIAIGLSTGQDNHLYAAVLDSNLKITLKVDKSITNAGKVIVQSFAADNQQNVFFGFNGEYVITSAANTTSKSFKVNLPDDNVSKQVFILPSKINGPVKIIGLYGDDKRDMKGCYAMTIGTGFEQTPPEMEEFPGSIRMKYGTTLKNSHVSHYEDPFDYKSPFALLQGNDGSIVLLCQCIRYLNDGPTHASITSSYHYGNILHMRYDAGKKIVITEIPKTQYSFNNLDWPWRYYAVHDKGKTVVFYLENAHEVDSTKKNAFVMATAIVTSDGELSREIVSGPSKPDGFLFLPAGMQQLSPTTFFIPLKKEKYKVGMTKTKAIMQKMVLGKIEMK